YCSARYLLLSVRSIVRLCALSLKPKTPQTFSASVVQLVYHASDYNSARLRLRPDDPQTFSLKLLSLLNSRHILPSLRLFHAPSVRPNFGSSAPGR
ncbi:MAG: hypothetical protein ACKOE3_00210, partial [Betaproteobacteria bacterium]